MFIGITHKMDFNKLILWEITLKNKRVLSEIPQSHTTDQPMAR